MNSAAEAVKGLQLRTDTLTHPPLQELQPKPEPVWYEDHSGDMGNLTELDARPLPLTRETVASVRETPEQLRELLAGVTVGVEQYRPSADVDQYSQLPLSEMDLDINLEHVAMDLDEDEPGDETIEPADAKFTNQQIEQLKDVVDQLLELEKHVQRTVEHLNPLATDSYDYGHSSAELPPLPLESTQSMPAPEAQADRRQPPQLDFPHTQGSLPYCEYPPFPVLSDHTPSAPLDESNIPVEPVEGTNMTTDIDVVMPGVKVQPSESVSLSQSSEPKKTVQSSNTPQVSVSASSQNETELSESAPIRLRDRSLSPGEITPSPEPPPVTDNKEPGSFAHFTSKEQHTSPGGHLSHVPYPTRSHSSPHRKRMSGSPLPSASSQIRSGRTGYGRRYYRSRSRSHSPRRKHRYRSHSRTPSPRGSLKSWRSRTSRSPSPSRHHHYSSSSSHMYRGHRPSSAASRSRRTDSDSSPPRRYRRSSRSRSRSLSPIRGKRSRRSRSFSPSRRTTRHSQNQSVSPSRSRRSQRRNSSRSPVHSAERRKDHGGVVPSKSSGSQGRAHSPTRSSVPKPSTESESEEEMELLRLKREAIMSMIQKGNAAKPTDAANSEAEPSSGKEEGLKSSSDGMEDGKGAVMGTNESVGGTLRDGEREESSVAEEKDASEEVDVKKTVGEQESSKTTAADVKSESSGESEAVGVRRGEMKVELKPTCETCPPGPQEPVKPVEPVQQGLVHKPTETVESTQLTAPATVHSKPPSRKLTPTYRVGSKTSSPAVSPPPSSSSTALGQREQKTRGIAPVSKATAGVKPTSSAKVCCVCRKSVRCWYTLSCQRSLPHFTSKFLATYPVAGIPRNVRYVYLHILWHVHVHVYLETNLLGCR